MRRPGEDCLDASRGLAIIASPRRIVGVSRSMAIRRGKMKPIALGSLTLATVIAASLGASAQRPRGEAPPPPPRLGSGSAKSFRPQSRTAWTSPTTSENNWPNSKRWSRRSWRRSSPPTSWADSKPASPRTTTRTTSAPWEKVAKELGVTPGPVPRRVPQGHARPTRGRSRPASNASATARSCPKPWASPPSGSTRSWTNTAPEAGAATAPTGPSDTANDLRRRRVMKASYRRPPAGKSPSRLRIRSSLRSISVKRRS